jgi:outer membrane autotransporter protein
MVAARDAFAAALSAKAAPPVPSTGQRWGVWGSAYGGRNRTDGDAVVGSNDLKATVGGFAAGADYRVSATSVIGAAVAIGETRWDVSSLGKGNADVAQVGGYASSRWEALYLSGAVALASHRATTDRIVTIAGTDRLQAGFNATSFGGRIEGGYRFGGMAPGLTPYAAVQVQGIHTPSYGEVATSGSSQFALRYAAQAARDIRTELGAWLDARHASANGSQLVLRGRAAWAHDYDPGSRVNAAFQTLPGAGFTIDGAAAPRDTALTSAVAELRFTNGVSLIGKFDGAFSDRSHTLAGTGTVRYSW